MRNILVINPGSTSTKIAVFCEKKILFEKKIQHNGSEISRYETIMDQFQFRKDAVLQLLIDMDFDVNRLSIIMGRGGLVKAVESGVYEVTDALKHDLKIGYSGNHASNLGGLIASDIAKDLKGVKAYIADPVVVDELQEVARISGHPLFKRKSIFHALNHKAVAREYAAGVGVKYEDLNLVVAHMGGGISVAAHKKGRVIDVNQALDGEGPFSPERSGSLPMGEIVDMCFSGKYSKDEVSKMLIGNGGWMAYLKTNNSLVINSMIDNGDQIALLVRDALAYQTAKLIGAMATVLDGKVDAVLITGGLAYCELIISYIKEKVDYISKVVIIPGENEMQSLASNALLLLDEEVKGKIYV